jgi:hypothetical protein
MVAIFFLTMIPLIKMTCLREAAAAKAGCHDFAEENVFSD